MADEKGPDEKIICVPLKDPAWMRISDIHDIPAELRKRDRALLPAWRLRRGEA
jgi:inorganic pyrophosphatase